MAQLQDMGRFVAEGYSFFSENDAALAESERRKVQYLEQHLDYDKPETILRVYRKAIEERIFRSPVGHFFLKKMQDYLLKQPTIDGDQVDPIPMYVTFDGEFRSQPGVVRNRVKPAQTKEEPKKSALPVSVILNLLLTAAVIAMFVIALKSDQPNILNYEQNITNKYASWEQELTERERVVREKERELHIAE